MCQGGTIDINNVNNNKHRRREANSKQCSLFSKYIHRSQWSRRRHENKKKEPDRGDLEANEVVGVVGGREE